MSARIAPEPISTSLATADYRSRSMLADPAPMAPDNGSPRSPDRSPLPAEPTPQTAAPPPPEPPGAMFAAAVIAGALSPKPVTAEEIVLRVGSSWQPPGSDLRLADRLV